MGEGPGVRAGHIKVRNFSSYPIEERGHPAPFSAPPFPHPYPLPNGRGRKMKKTAAISRDGLLFALEGEQNL
jgi:hypothetical protein